MQNLTWWQRAVVYEVYPRSFQDTDGNGVGDLAGILRRLDYLAGLGVDAIWISPIYPSPMADFGYDVADYCGIDPIFGAMADFDRLLAAVHERGMRLILDFVPNHTSSQHPWFLESRSSRTNAKRDWYLWRDEPNNWLSNFGGPGWELDEATGQYYYHSFLKEQPDLNWRNPAVKAAMLDVLRFWLAKGVDGFRVDVMWLMIKDAEFRDNPDNPGYRPGQPENQKHLPVYNANRPEVHEIVAEMRRVVDGFGDRVLIGEIYLPLPQLVTYYGADLKGANLPFNFQLLQCAWSAKALAGVIAGYDAALPTGAWPNWVLGNHDQPRLASRVGAHQARVAAMLLLTLPGTLTIYYGEEIGMCDVKIAPEDVQDPAEKNEPGIGAGRDPERTPMPWDATPLAGFTEGLPWLPLGPDHEAVNVSVLEADPASILHLYRRLIALRRSHAALVAGRVEAVAAEGNLLRYGSGGDGERFVVLLNLGHEEMEAGLSADGAAAVSGTIAMSTCLDREGEAVRGTMRLRAAEGVIVRARSVV